MGVRRLKLTPKVWSLLLVLLGALAVSYGVALIYVPAGVIVAGLSLVAVGLLLIDQGR